MSKAIGILKCAAVFNNNYPGCKQARFDKLLETKVTKLKSYVLTQTSDGQTTQLICLFSVSPVRTTFRHVTNNYITLTKMFFFNDLKMLPLT